MFIPLKVIGSIDLIAIHGQDIIAYKPLRTLSLFLLL